MHFSPIRLSGISQSHIIQDLIKYNVATVTQLVPSQSTNYYYEIFVSHHYFIVQRLSIYDNNQTYVFHNSIIVPASDVEAVVVHFFRQKVLYTPP